MRIEPLLAALASAIIASAAHAETDLARWLAQATATGDWGGLRSRAESAGLAVEANYQTDLLANPIGGERQGLAYAGTMEISLDVDLEKIVGLEGTSFFIAGYWASGDDLSHTEIGNLIGVSQAFNGRTVGLAQMYFAQELFDGALDVTLGRLSPGDDFATSDLYADYVSAGINGNPFAIPENVASFVADPAAIWGMRATAQLSEQLHVGVGIYNADPDVTADGEHGVDFKLNPEDGVLAVAEIGYQWNQGEHAASLPGSATFGGYFDSSDFDYQDGSDRTRNGTYGFYLLVDQMVYREGGPGSDQDSDQGLTPWGALTLAPDQQINPVPLSATGGLV